MDQIGTGLVIIAVMIAGYGLFMVYHLSKIREAMKEILKEQVVTRESLTLQGCRVLAEMKKHEELLKAISKEKE